MGAQVKIAPGVYLDDIIAWTDQLLESDEADRRRRGFLKPSKPKPDPDALYARHLLATMPDLQEQVKSCLTVQPTRTDKEVSDLLAAWPLCNTEQLTGLMGSVIRRCANQVLGPRLNAVSCAPTDSATSSPTRGYATWPTGTGLR